jgi:chorismate mutase
VNRSGPLSSFSTPPPLILRAIAATGSDRAGPGHDAGMTANTPPDLERIRDELDLVDRRLVEVLTDRAFLISDVIAYKRANGMAVVDRPREEAMLEKIGAIASVGGLDPRIARQVLRAVIDAFTILEVEQLGPDV